MADSKSGIPAVDILGASASRMKRVALALLRRAKGEMVRANTAERQRDVLLQALHGELMDRHELHWWADVDARVSRCRYCQTEGRVSYAVVHAPGCPAAEAQALLDGYRATLRAGEGD